MGLVKRLVVTRVGSRRRIVRIAVFWMILKMTAANGRVNRVPRYVFSHVYFGEHD